MNGPTTCSPRWRLAFRPDEIRAILSDSDGPWSASEVAVLRAVDELCGDNCVTDATWSALTAARDDLELIELLLLVGFYRMNAGMLNSLGVRPEPGRPDLARCPPRLPPALDARKHRRSAWLRRRGRNVAGHLPPPEWRSGPDAGAPSHQQRHIRLGVERSRGCHAADHRWPGHEVESLLLQGADDDTRSGGHHLRRVVHGDRVDGGVTITGGGTFPFDGTRST